MQFPKVLKNFNAFVDGTGYAGAIDEVELPKLTIKGVDHRAGGMDSDIELDMGTEKLEMTLTTAGPESEIMKHWAKASGDTAFTLRGALADKETVKPVVINATGKIKEVEMGTWKTGEKSQGKYVASLTYYKLSVDGADLVEIDVENMIRRVNGTDVLQEIRSAIGL
jgi:P2 family phage contractile tail tube protein